MRPGPIMVDGNQYLFDGNVHKQGKRLSLYLRNRIGARFVIKTDAYDVEGNKMPEDVAIYVHVDDAGTDEYRDWWNKIIKPVRR